MLLLNAVLIPLYWASVGPLRRYRRPNQVVWSRVSCWLAGLRLRITGVPHTGGPTLYVCNHLSYLDIPVLASKVNATFVAKADVARWPLFGVAARLTGTIFVHRVGSEARVQSHQMLSRLVGGENLLLFAEGTSTDGSAVAPFKSTLFAIAEQAPAGIDLMVQPMSISYARARDGRPLTGALRDLYCWFGEATMFPHLMRMLSLPGAEMEIRFLDPIPARGTSRKELARRAEAAVAASVATVNQELLGLPDPSGDTRPAGVSSSPPAASDETSRSAPVFR